MGPTRVMMLRTLARKERIVMVWGHLACMRCLRLVLQSRMTMIGVSILICLGTSLGVNVTV